jgi:hypothetical protein
VGYSKKYCRKNKKIFSLTKSPDRLQKLIKKPPGFYLPTVFYSVSGKYELTKSEDSLLTLNTAKQGYKFNKTRFSATVY